MSEYHKSVLLQEAVMQLNVQSGKKYIDGTLGGGGHTQAILSQGGKVIALDVDDDALAHVARAANASEHLQLVKGNFKDIDTLAKARGFLKVAGILLDLGVSSHQFDEPERGFSLQASGPLDMRMDQTLSVTAKDLVNGLTKDELADLLLKLGEEPFAKKIAQRIVDYRRTKQIETTIELEQLIRRSVPWTKHTNPSTRVFQALRIAVNDELNSLREVLPKAITLLEPKGRLVIITFHSLEDRIVKHAFMAFEEQGLGQVVTKKPIIPSTGEIEANTRSRSAKMRVFEKK